MTLDLRPAVWATLPVALLLTGCGTNTAESPAASRTSPAATPAVPGPTFADVSKTDGGTAAKLYGIDFTAHSAVIMPIIFMTGPDYCKAYKVTAKGGQCDREWVTEDSHVKVTLPVSPTVTLMTFDDGENDCIGTMKTGGTCPTTALKFAAKAKDNSQELVYVTVKDGTITRIAEEYTP